MRALESFEKEREKKPGLAITNDWDKLDFCSKQILFVLAFVYAAAAWTLKASILFLYVRLFPLNDMLFRIGIYTMAVLSMGICIASMVVLALACQPVSYFWGRFDDPTTMTAATAASTGRCIDIGCMFIGLASINVFLDFLLLAIPIPRILKLQMTARKKLVVITSLLLGIL